MGRLIQRVVVTVAVDLVAYAISEAIIKSVKKIKNPLIIDAVVYDVK